MELTTMFFYFLCDNVLFMMSKIQNLNGTHNIYVSKSFSPSVVYDVKDTKFEWNSQHRLRLYYFGSVVYDVKDTKFEWNSQRTCRVVHSLSGCL